MFCVPPLLLCHFICQIVHLSLDSRRRDSPDIALPGRACLFFLLSFCSFIRLFVILFFYVSFCSFLYVIMFFYSSLCSLIHLLFFYSSLCSLIHLLFFYSSFCSSFLEVTTSLYFSGSRTKGFRPNIFGKGVSGANANSNLAKMRQGRIHDYPSHVRVGRDSDKKA